MKNAPQNNSAGKKAWPISGANDASATQNITKTPCRLSTILEEQREYYEQDSKRYVNPTQIGLGRNELEMGNDVEQTKHDLFHVAKEWHAIDQVQFQVWNVTTSFVYFNGPGIVKQLHSYVTTYKMRRSYSYTSLMFALTSFEAMNLTCP